MNPPFKPGDKVICIDNPDPKHKSDFNGYGAGWKLGKKAVVRDYSRHSTVVWLDSGDGVYATALSYDTWRNRLE